MNPEKLALRRLIQAQKLLKEADEVMPPTYYQDSMASDVRFALRAVTMGIQNFHTRKARDESR